MNLSFSVSEKHRLLVVPTSEQLKNIFPNSLSMHWNGHQSLVLPHTNEITQFMRNLKYDVPAPINSYYPYPGRTPFEVQRKTCAMMTLNKRGYVLNGLGTGKTSCALWAWDFLNLQGEAGKLVVFAPLSTLNFVWMNEIFRLLPGRKAVVVHGLKAKRLEKIADPDADIFIVNHDGISIVQEAILARGDIDTLIIDELAAYRNGGTSRSKIMRKFAKSMKWCYGMTGGPTPNSPTDVWGEAQIVTPGSVPKHFGALREQLMLKINQFKWVPKPNAAERAMTALVPAVRFTLDDIMELPPIIERTIDIALGPKQDRVYKDLVRHCRALVETKEITAANAGAVLMKLLQVSTGWVYTKNRGIISLDNDNRLNALIDLILGAEHKVLVFVPFKHALKGISDKLTLEGIEHETVSGDTPANERARIFNLFQNTGKYKVLPAHPTCLAHGITLTSADTIIWFSPIASLETYTQANARIRRVGQKHKQLILHLQGTPIEKRMYSLLAAKEKLQDKLLELLELATP